MSAAAHSAHPERFMPDHKGVKSVLPAFSAAARNGAMAAVFGPLPDIERIVAEGDGYVVVANINSTLRVFNEAGVLTIGFIYEWRKGALEWD